MKIFKKKINYDLKLRILSLILVLILINVFKNLPYFNLVLSSWRLESLILVFCIIILKLSSRSCYIISVVLVFMMAFFTLVGKISKAEEMAILMFIAFSIGIFIEVFNFLKTDKKNIL